MSTTAPQPRSGLRSMQKLSPRVYLLRPSPAAHTTRESRADNPALIMIFGWMNAPEGPLAKYVNQHQALFPASSILLVTCNFAGMTIPWLGLGEARIAATAARAILEQDQEDLGAKKPSSNNVEPIDCSSRPRLLLHVFSNAGSTMLYYLYTAYAESKPGTSSKPSPVLPLHATVFDSAPAPFTYQTLLQGILDGAPSGPIRLAIMPIAYIYVALVWVIVAVLRLPDHIGDLGPRAHNDLTRVRETLRVYIYGPADRITPASGVETHANKAAEQGFNIRREVFDGSGHVAHARKHNDRYWSVIRQTWEDASQPRVDARL
ncbi:putative indole-diterpene biosynthesis protein [Rhypophila decipiens]|uniref:Indole-diterpene biosynthesis protein n=1 Tax=Rhypophila decipiens TaxID=261697 RepID=A0AAN6XTU2_9PEZI|nr:putative indole-diterpene biosynthesis protein [Rhypophila decipiens]